MSHPPLPNVPYDHYLPYAELSDVLHRFAEARPDLLRLEVIGQSRLENSAPFGSCFSHVFRS